MLQRTNRKRPKATLLDMDGSLVDVSSALSHVLKQTKDWDAFHSEACLCPPLQEGIEFAIERYNAGDTIVVGTARMQTWHRPSRLWLEKELPMPFDGPFMREDGDFRPDYIVKREMYHRLSLVYDIRYALEDSPAVIEVWKELGITVKEMERIDWNAESTA